MNQGRLLAILGGAFGAFGIVFLTVAVVVSLTTAGFLAGAERTEGVVVDVVERTTTDRDSDGFTRRRTSFYPVVEFTAPDGNPVVFESDVGSSPSSHQVGDRVEVAYDPGEPSDARLTGFLSLYLFPLIFGGLGLVFAAVGTPLFVVGWRKLRRRAWLLRHGRETWSEDLDVELVRNVRINHRHPYVVKATWRDPHGQSRTATSDYRRRDPSPEFREGSRVRVLFNPDRPEQCLVDLDRP
jgi:hypothetical protein